MVYLYIYLDESGDLGFSSNSSNHIIIALLITKEPNKIERCIKRIRLRNLKKKLKELPEIKFNKSDDNIRKKVLKCIIKEPIEINYIVLKKNKSNPNPFKSYTSQNHTHEIYNNITGQLLNSIQLEKSGKIKLTVDKRTPNKLIRADFDQHIQQEVNFKIDIVHENSEFNKCIQATDFIAGAIAGEMANEENRELREVMANVDIRKIIDTGNPR